MIPIKINAVKPGSGTGWNFKIVNVTKPHLNNVSVDVQVIKDNEEYAPFHITLDLSKTDGKSDNEILEFLDSEIKAVIVEYKRVFELSNKLSKFVGNLYAGE